MIVQFPDLDTFRLVLTSGVVPATVSLAAATVSFSETGVPTIEPSVTPPRNFTTTLKKFGVQSVKDHVGPTQEVTCWIQALPVVADPHPPELNNQSPVLFEVSATEQLPSLVSEMLRLGNDRQSYRWLQPTDAQPQAGERVLLRVIGPPYYSLLRATEGGIGKRTGPIRAFIERAPRVWVELGFNHPLADQLRPAEGQMLLLRAPREWMVLENTAFHDIYEIVDFPIAGETVQWEEAKLESPMQVPLRLAAGNAADLPEMWILRRNAVDQLDTLVRDAEDKLLARLNFAVTHDDTGSPTIILRVRPSKLPPPTLALVDALGFKPFWKLPNLFLPVGTRLMPTLRREKVRQLLAEDPSRIVWLFPEKEAEGNKVGVFVPESLPDEAFRPLEEWINYIIDHQRQQLTSWMQAMQFEFESFQCPEESSGSPKPPSGRKSKSDSADRLEGNPEVIPDAGAITARRAQQSRKSAGQDPQFNAEMVQQTPSELRLQRDDLEKQFFDIEGSLDAPERLALWPKLAKINAGLREPSDASLCWVNSFWESKQPDAEELWAWLLSENPHAHRTVTAGELDRLLARSSPTASELRQFVGQILYAMATEPNSPVIRERLPKLTQYLEMNETRLGVRAVWLSWMALSYQDELTLARVRDRLIARLHEEGLNQERDMPTFLRFAGLRDSARARLVHDRLESLHTLALRWNGEEPTMQANRSYIDLMFAYGQARVGETTLARQLLTRASDALALRRHPAGGRDEVHQFLSEAFRHRIDQVLAGRPATGPLPNELLTLLERIDKVPRYAIDRLLEQSRILEPAEKFDPYRRIFHRTDPLLRMLDELPDIRQPEVLKHRVTQLVAEGLKPNQPISTRRYLLTQLLAIVPRVGEELALSLLQFVPETLVAPVQPNETNAIESQCNLLERGMTISALYDRGDVVRDLSNRFLHMLKGRPTADRAEMINRVAGDCLRNLRRLGLRDQAQAMIDEISTLILNNRPVDQVIKAEATNAWQMVRTLLYLGSGWIDSGRAELAEPVMEEARHMLFEPAVSQPRMQPLHYTQLTRAYVAALSRLPAETTLARLEEMFKRLQPLTNSFTTSAYYSRLHLNIIEDVVNSIVSDEFTQGPNARRWLDEDEFLVRRRIHRDMRRRLSGSE
ncbi:hypothetical protein [Tuwongella immobilis]|uniref:FtsH ternary system domain-containing protein n=1 Tax=Tuwongella immobilis TaxID=692036 RepID=A0A6C2YKN0_9BACT|nr:hypothetical protein [Tuwongella immobilis]VIP01986.1 Uncharacterized protein OS=Myxococcus stipitatus (strain DSM 14675 / JCM 12634 / Mx s8) GN=MYSTI_03368 PE=4 SV=1 [Tuwongella immobilis]VTS00045.1 Uncharacterized protein OS=Myxococcus stipitatus (strain DSM 14675 / JCM 12634 / Mx s8) GN=MYSTI_03368 PE=4 SV=1 [Tuwongella immobilis]